MKKILLSFIGNNDCYLNENKKGAILSILENMTFDDLYILYNHDKYLQYASEILMYCKKNYPALKVHYEPALSIDPTDYNTVYPAMVLAVKSILKIEGTKEVDYTISVTSGTPTMHTCWLFIIQGGIIKGKLIQSSRESGIKEISFSLDDYPKITEDKTIKTEMTRLSRENVILKQKLLLEYDEIIGEHPSIVKLKETLLLYSKHDDISVFISGESGTGKELAARCLHYNSERKEKPFVAVNCGSISESLFESEFFGHKKGSFTSAIADHEGHFSVADGGTLFLDEIGDLPLSMQTKLLRVLETQTIQPVGGKPKKIDVRLISASNKNLSEMIKEKTFREDLYYRIVQAELFIPPLRDRATDIILLANHFISEYSLQNHEQKHFSPAAEKKILNNRWTGNIRELKSVVRMSYINSLNDTVEAKDILIQETYSDKFNIEIPNEGIDLENIILPSIYQAALKKANGNATQAANLLGLEPHTFRARLKKVKAVT
jgi:DNA-binding NtrC family response regulator